MELSRPPAVTLATGYTDDHDADRDCPERHLWLAVLAQAGEDLFSADETVRRDALAFFQSPNLLSVLAMAGLDNVDVSWLRHWALEFAIAPLDTPRLRGKRISYKGRVCSLAGWAALTDLSIHILGRRLRDGWSVARALSTPAQKRIAKANTDRGTD